MQRSDVLALVPLKRTYHKHEQVQIIERKEDDNIILQGDHMVIVFKEFEAIIWEMINDKNSINDIVQYFVKKLEGEYDTSDVEDEIVQFFEKLESEELVHYEEH